MHFNDFLTEAMVNKCDGLGRFAHHNLNSSLASSKRPMCTARRGVYGVLGGFVQGPGEAVGRVATRSAHGQHTVITAVNTRSTHGQHVPRDYWKCHTTNRNPKSSKVGKGKRYSYYMKKILIAQGRRNLNSYVFLQQDVAQGGLC